MCPIKLLIHYYQFLFYFELVINYNIKIQSKFMIFQKSLNKNEYLSIIKDEQDDIVSIKFMSLQNKKKLVSIFIYL